MTNQKHYLHLDSDVSSVQNFCSSFSDIILWATSAGVVKCWPFSQAELICYIFWNIFSALAENLANENILRKVNKSIWKTLKLNNKYGNLFKAKSDKSCVIHLFQYLLFSFYQLIYTIYFISFFSIFFGLKLFFATKLIH